MYINSIKNNPQRPPELLTVLLPRELAASVKDEDAGAGQQPDHNLAHSILEEIQAIRRAVEANGRSDAEVPKRRAYPLREAAKLLGVSLTKIKDEIRDGRIAIVLAGKRRRVLDAKLNRYLLAQKRR